MFFLQNKISYGEGVKEMIKVKAKLLRENKVLEITLDDNARVIDLIHKLGHTVEDVIVLKDELPLVEDDILEENGEYIIMPVASGG